MSLHPTMQSPGPTWCGLLYNSWIWLQMNCRPISEALSVMGCWMLRSSLWLGFEDLLPRQASGQKALVSSTTTRSLDNWGEVRGGVWSIYPGWAHCCLLYSLCPEPSFLLRYYHKDTLSECLCCSIFIFAEVSKSDRGLVCVFQLAVSDYNSFVMWIFPNCSFHCTADGTVLFWSQGQGLGCKTMTQGYLMCFCFYVFLSLFISSSSHRSRSCFVWVPVTTCPQILFT